MRKWLIVPTVAALAAITALAQAPAQDRETTAPKPVIPNTIRLLNQRIPEVTLDQVPLEQVMDWVKEVTGANVVVRWQTLADAGIARDKSITLRVKSLRLSQILWLVMNEAGGIDVKLAYRASGSVLVLSTEADLSQEMVLKVYDVSDLLSQPTMFANAAHVDPTQLMNNLGSGQGGGSGQLIQGGVDSERGESPPAGGPDMDTLVRLITDTVEPDSWRANGGPGQIFPFRTLIVVYNNLLVHQRLGGYTQ